VEVAMNERVRRKEALSLSRRLESLHLTLSTPCGTMRVFGSIVQISALSMFDLWKELAVGHAVASQLVGHDHPRHILKAL
jgi:hypothetical protein